MDRYHAEAQADEYLGWPAMREELLAELSTARPTRPTTFCRQARAPGSQPSSALPAGRTSAKVKLRRKIKTVVPARALRLVPPRVVASTRLVALRAYAASRMAQILRDEAAQGHVATQGHVAADGRALT